jgi:hypothetical protein
MSDRFDHMFLDCSDWNVQPPGDGLLPHTPYTALHPELLVRTGIQDLAQPSPSMTDYSFDCAG